MPTLQPVNLYLRPIGGTPDGALDKRVGKVVPVGGKWIFHEHVKGSMKRRDANAWGLNTALVAELKRFGIRDAYLRDTTGTRTYHATIAELERSGLEQQLPDGFGKSLNLPLDRWKALPQFSTPYVPDAAKRVVCVDDAADLAA